MAEAKAITSVEPLDIERPTKGTRTQIFQISALAIGIFCVALDNNILATAIPTIADHFHSPQDIGWYGSSYLLASCSAVLFFGRIYTLCPAKWVFLCSLFLFDLGSLICALAPSSKALIAGRLIAGVGDGGMFPGSLLIVSQQIPLKRQPSFNGVLACFYTLGNILGPLLGGAITYKLSWRWCFYINLPFGAVTATLVLIAVSSEWPIEWSGSWEPKKQLLAMDPAGTLCLIPVVPCLLLALEWGGQQYTWENPRIIALLSVTGALAMAFVFTQYLQLTGEMLPRTVVRNGAYWGSLGFAFCMCGAMSVSMYYLPLWFQVVKEASQLESGIMNLPMTLGVGLVALIAGHLVSFTGYFLPWMLTGAVLCSICSGLLTTLQIDSGRSQWIGYQAGVGIGIGLGLNLPVSLIPRIVSASERSRAMEMMAFVQLMAGALVLTIAHSVFQSLLVRSLPQTDSMDAPQMVNIGFTNLRDQFPDEKTYAAVLEVYSHTLQRTLYIGFACSLLSIVMGAGISGWTWKKRPSKM
ncbi:MFS general substrate transporter [Aspergillus indologenus CBS 114.80]|uniref:MFS general substrate transporter n=1 Tax=Aspergillus indologenus CBS 114.80 TaxID=1450541 RepID=A0A2V5IEA5_9EURO|nr:MFS general substrate transporter [Aspergillus indologenus CBS 114.80]